MTDHPPKGDKLKICVIGAGASGILALVTLQAAGFTLVTAFEKGDDLGGTWFYNRYPGVACDVPSFSYRYSFAPHAGWSKMHAPAAEIHAYLKRVAEDHDVVRHIRFGEEVVAATYDDGLWSIETASGYRDRFDVVISAVGVLHHAKLPEIPGLNSFAGVASHTMHMPRDLQLAGRKVGVIGTGSTAVQLVSAIQAEAGHLAVFQRTPQWIVPLDNPVISEDQKAAYRADPTLLRAEYDRLNNDLNTQFAAAVINENPEAHAALRQLCLDNLATVRDPVLRAKLTPDYEVGCKRLIMAERFYAAIQSPNVTLIDDAITRIEPAGVRTADGTLHELDVLLLATGFNPHTPYGATHITGKDGLTLAEAWRDGANAYKQVTMAGFPNWFMLGGPGSPIGNFSFLLTAEHQMNYLLQLVRLIAAGKANAIMPKADAQAAFNVARNERMKTTVWASGCTTWYRDKSGNIPFWPWNYETFARNMQAPDLDDFDMI